MRPWPVSSPENSDSRQLRPGPATTAMCTSQIVRPACDNRAAMCPAVPGHRLATPLISYAAPTRPVTAGACPPHLYCWRTAAQSTRAGRAWLAGDRRGRGRRGAPRSERDLLRTRLRDAREQGADLRLPVPAVAAQGTNGREL